MPVLHRRTGRRPECGSCGSGGAAYSLLSDLPAPYVSRGCIAYGHGDGRSLTAQPLEIWRKLIAEEGLGPQARAAGAAGMVCERHRGQARPELVAGVIDTSGTAGAARRERIVFVLLSMQYW